jgi:PAS domain S-box-containing protein
MATDAENIFQRPASRVQFHQWVGLLVAGAVAVGLLVVANLNQVLHAARGSDIGLVRSLLASFSDPLLLALMGMLIALSGMCIWIVLRYEHRLALFAESRARNRAIVDNMLDGAVHIDQRGRIVGLNAAAEGLFGYRIEELRGQPVTILLAPPQRESMERTMVAEHSLGLPAAMIGRHRIEARHRDGTTRSLSFSVTEVHVGGYLVFTAVARVLNDAEPAPPELIPTSQEGEEPRPADSNP